MRVIYKFQFPVHTGFVLQVPAEAKIIHMVGIPDILGKIRIWVELNTHESPTLRRFEIFGTGDEIPEDSKLGHVGTALCGEFVWHVYERKG